MTAKETKLQDIIEGTKQFIVPLFQRTYSWDIREWTTLWKDIIELCEMETPRTHFMGSIVNMPTVSVPEGVAKFLLIDGQQRLTTNFILLALLRDFARNNNDAEFADEINNTLIVNPYKKGNEYFKLLPTQGDREVFENLIKSKEQKTDSKIIKAYNFFERKLRQEKPDIYKLKNIITTYFSIVSITLDTDDNPHLVFESLNAKGQPLSQADLIRNYFFMRIHIDRQEELHSEYWRPMQESLESNLTEFIRHFLMRDGGYVRESDIYSTLKSKITVENSIEKLKELHKFSQYYKCLLFPEFEDNDAIKFYLKRLSQTDITTAYPLLLNFYNGYVELKIISAPQFAELLRIIENYLVRRLVCNVPSNTLNKIFPEVYKQLIKSYSSDFVEGLKLILQTKNYPKDTEFRKFLKQGKFYGGSPLNVRTRLILETIEQSFKHKEQIHFDSTKVTLEHIMPQTLSEWWQNHLGEQWEIVHELNLHGLGNLTLSAYNSELSNDNYHNKKDILLKSHLELNKYFLSIEKWDREEIENRAEALAEICLKAWAYFGTQAITNEGNLEVTGTIPVSLRIMGAAFQVQSWRDVLEETLNTVADLEPEKFEIIATKYPRFVGKDKNKFGAIRKLKNGYFIEVRLSAKDVQRFCQQALETIELTSEDWKVTTVNQE